MSDADTGADSDREDGRAVPEDDCVDPTATVGQYMDVYTNITSRIFPTAVARSADFATFWRMSANFERVVQKKKEYLGNKLPAISDKTIKFAVWMHVVCTMHAAKNPVKDAVWEKSDELSMFYDNGLLPKTKMPVHDAELDALLNEENDINNENNDGPEEPDELQQGHSSSALGNIDFNEFDADEEMDLDAAVLPKKKNIVTVTDVLKERGLFGPIDLLRRSESLAAAAYCKAKGFMPRRSSFYTHAFATHEYDEQPGSSEMRDFIKQSITRSLELLAKKAVEAKWQNLFNPPSYAAPIAVDTPVVQQQQRPQQNYQAPQQNYQAPQQRPQQNYQAPQQNYQAPQQNYQAPQPRANFVSSFNPPTSMATYGTSAPMQQSNVLDSSDIPNRVYWKTVLEEMGVLQTVSDACYQRIGAGGNVAQAIEEEMKQLKFKCGESMPRKGTRARDNRGFNVYTTDDLEDMHSTAHRLLAARGFIAQ